MCCSGAGTGWWDLRAASTLLPVHPSMSSSAGHHLNAPIVGIAVSRAGSGRLVPTEDLLLRRCLLLRRHEGPHLNCQLSSDDVPMEVQRGEERVRPCRHPDLRRQSGPQLLQCVAIPSRNGKTHLAIEIAIAPRAAGRRVRFVTTNLPAASGPRSSRSPACARPLRPAMA